MEIREILPWDKPHFCRMAHDFYRLPARHPGQPCRAHL